MKFILSAVCLLAIGCMTLPTDETQPSAAGYVGDRAHTSLSEVVVTVPGPSSSSDYNNLHIGFSAIINAKQVSYFDLYDVERIVRRMEPRVASRVVELVLGTGSVSPAQLPTLRARIAADAQAEFVAAFSKWQHASEFEVELVITSLYFTNGSVGREDSVSRRWW